MSRALSGLNILDLSTRYAAAWCCRLLADFGAAGRDGCAILVQEKNVGHILGAASIALMKTR